VEDFNLLFSLLFPQQNYKERMAGQRVSSPTLHLAPQAKSAKIGA
jgi:hypothetical protein